MLTSLHVLYSEKDLDFHYKAIMPLLNKHEISMETEDLFPLGKSKFECLCEALEVCKATLVLLTPEFLDEKEKLYTLDLVMQTAIDRKKFKVVFVLRQKLTTLGELPKNVKMFLKTAQVIKEYKEGWEQKLVQSLQNRTKRSVSAGLKCGTVSCIWSCVRYKKDPE